MAMGGTYQESVSYRRLRSNVESSTNGSYSTPSLSFALGAALVLLVTALATFCFSFWYHWRKMSRGRRSSQLPAGRNANLAIFVNAWAALPLELAAGDSAKAFEEPTQVTSVIPVVMPGDDTPKFVARACEPAVGVSEDSAHAQADRIQNETPKIESCQ